MKKDKKPSLLSGIGNLIEEENIESNQSVETNLKKEEVLSHYNLIDIKEIDEDLKDYLMKTTFEIHQITSKAYTKLGEIFTDAQKKLSASKVGTFDKWIVSIGFNKMQVNRLINRNIMLRNNSDKKELIEKLPITLSYEISSPSCDEHLKNAVLDGTIKTLKEFKEYKVLALEKIEDEIDNIETITPIDYNFIKNKTTSLEKNFKKSKSELFTKELSEEESKRVNKILEKLEKDIEKLEKILKK